MEWPRSVSLGLKVKISELSALREDESTDELGEEDSNDKKLEVESLELEDDEKSDDELNKSTE